MAALLLEVQRLKGEPLARGGEHGPQVLSANDMLHSNDVISARLVTFRNLQELVEQDRWVAGWLGAGLQCDPGQRYPGP